MSNGEQIFKANGVNLCVETFGTAGDPTILLIHGASASMLWWEAELCERIAAAGRHVIRFDNRDTGRSVSYPPGRPEYALPDMADDAVGILDTLGIDVAHFVGRSMAGGIVIAAAQQHPGRVASMTLVSTTAAGEELPPMSTEFLDYVGAGTPDPEDHPAVVEYVVGLMRVYSAGSPYFDEGGMRTLAEQDVARTVNIAACLVNHFVIDTAGSNRQPLSALGIPTLVVHGERDPVFPLPHGKALQQAIPGAELLVLSQAGHELPPQLWDVFVPALTKHTSRPVTQQSLSYAAERVTQATARNSANGA
ncbi:MAG TPA: alpha/beta hydrolase [Jatrophihabitans sp.]|jgi:pimeloyl-ACP methyl ester carboxylesterase